MRDNLLDSGFIPQFLSKSPESRGFRQETPEVAKTTAMERAPEAGHDSCRGASLNDHLWSPVSHEYRNWGNLSDLDIF